VGPSTTESHDPRAIGQEFGVRFVLQGGVTASGDKVRIGAQLLDTTTGGQLWSRTFEGSLTDLFALQDEVTAQVRASVGPQMVVAAARDIDTRKNSGKVADLLLRARALLLQNQSVANLQTIGSLCHDALALDPGNAAALSCAARSLWLLQANFSQSLGLDRKAGSAMLGRAEDLARQALRTAPGDPTLYYVLSDAALDRGDFEAARSALEHALELDPRLPATYNNLGAMYQSVGEAARAHELFQKGLQVPSYLPPVILYGNLSITAFMLGRADEALSWARKAVEADPDKPDLHANLAMAWALKGDEARARAAAREALRLEPGFRLQWAETTPWPGKEDDWRVYLETRVRPAARLAGLPE
jgi:tetratricopeptide (TPR) repeat protein